MLVIDIDDTLLTDEGNITNETIEHIHKAIQSNVIVTLATGRMFISTKKLADLIGLNLPVICYQGALIKDLKSGNILFEKNLPSESVRNLVKYCSERKLHLHIYSNDQLFVREENDKVRKYSLMHNVPYTVEENFERFIHEPVTKMVIYEEPDLIEKLLRDLADGNYYITKSKPIFLEILNKEVNKGFAAGHLCDHFGIELKEVIAIGDGWNDMKLLECVGLPIAVENAVDDLKHIAKHITTSNNNEGVSNVIKKFILSREV